MEPEGAQMQAVQPGQQLHLGNSDLTQLLFSWPQDGSSIANICGLQVRKQ